MFNLGKNEVTSIFIKFSNAEVERVLIASQLSDTQFKQATDDVVVFVCISRPLFVS